MEAATRIAIALLATIAWAAPALGQPANPYVRRLEAMSDLGRRAVLRGALVNSGQRCGRVDVAVQRGRYRNLMMWSVRCVPGGDFGLFVGPDGSAQVRTCADLARLALPKCGLPPAPPPPRPHPGRR